MAAFGFPGFSASGFGRDRVFRFPVSVFFTPVLVFAIGEFFFALGFGRIGVRGMGFAFGGNVGISVASGFPPGCVRVISGLRDSL